MRRLLSIALLAGPVLLLAGCGSVTYELPGHSAQAHVAAVTLAAGERRPALSTPRRLPAPGGFELGLASEDPAVVAVERVPGGGGSARYFLVARGPGTTAVHYVNRYAFPRDATTPEQRTDLRAAAPAAFAVTVTP